jgi:hypothetical protein
MPRDAIKVAVGRQHREIVPNAKLRQQSIDRADLQAAAAAFALQLRRVDVVTPVWHQERQGGKPVDNLLAMTRSREPLQQLLNNQPGREQHLIGADRAMELIDLRQRSGNVAP